MKIRVSSRLGLIFIILFTTPVFAEKDRRHVTTSRNDPDRAPAVLMTDEKMAEVFARRGKEIQDELNQFLDSLKAGDANYLAMDHNVLSALALSRILPKELEALSKRKGIDLAGAAARIEHIGMAVQFLRKLCEQYASQFNKQGKNPFRAKLSEHLWKDDAASKKAIEDAFGEASWQALKPYAKGGKLLSGFLNLDGAFPTDAAIIEKLDELNGKAFQAVPLPKRSVVDFKSESVKGDRTAADFKILNLYTGAEYSVMLPADENRPSEPKDSELPMKEMLELRNSTADKIPPRYHRAIQNGKMQFIDLDSIELPYSKSDRDQLRAESLHGFLNRITN